MKRNKQIGGLVEDLEYVLKNVNDPISQMYLKKVIEKLRQATTVQVGNHQISFISDELTAPYIVEHGSTHPSEWDSDYVDTNEVAEYFGVTTETVRNWIKDRKISAHQIGKRGKYRIPRDEFEFLKSRKEQDETEDVMMELLGDDYADDWEVEIEE